VLPLFEVTDGYIRVPDKPGLGIDIAPELINQYRIA
jgi:L-alanine-DL-glutamate epimerase-like enolase superfamily enzyme